MSILSMDEKDMRDGRVFHKPGATLVWLPILLTAAVCALAFVLFSLPGGQDDN